MAAWTARRDDSTRHRPAVTFGGALFPPEKLYNLGLKSQGYNGGGHEGLPRFRECSFKGEYPFGVVELSDPDLPLAVSITGCNPFIPLDDVNSGIPCAIPRL